jgi:replicative DNA helicase
MSEIANAVLACAQLPGEIQRPTRCKDLLWPVLERLEDEQRRGPGAKRIRTGVPDLDDVMCGWTTGQVALVSGTRGIGKTTLAMSAAIAAAEQGEPTLVVAADQDGRQLTSRALALRSGLPVWKLASRVRDRLHEEDYFPLARAAGILSVAPLYFMGGGTPSLDALRAIVRDSEETGKYGFVVIDGCDEHLGPDAESFVYGLKALADETDVAILVTLAVDAADRLARVPSTPDLRPAAIGADTFIRLSETRAADGRGRTGDRRVHVAVEWHRYGTPGEFDLLFRECLTRFERSLAPITIRANLDVQH